MRMLCLCYCVDKHPETYSAVFVFEMFVIPANLNNLSVKPREKAKAVYCHLYNRIDLYKRNED